MSKKFLVSLVLLGTALFAMPALAQISDNDWQSRAAGTHDRPSVPSDDYEGVRSHPDAFGNAQTIGNGKHDSFDDAPGFNPGVSDMFAKPHWVPPPNLYGPNNNEE